MSWSKINLIMKKPIRRKNPKINTGEIDYENKSQIRGILRKAVEERSRILLTTGFRYPGKILNGHIYGFLEKQNALDSVFTIVNDQSNLNFSSDFINQINFHNEFLEIIIFFDISDKSFTRHNLIWFNFNITMRKFKNKIKQNPLIYDYGYHVVTRSTTKSTISKSRFDYFLNEIIDHGFILKKSDSLFNLYKTVYNNYYPIYFLTLPYFKEIAENLRAYLSGSKYILKINVKNLNQLPDINSFPDKNLSVNMHDDYVFSNYYKTKYFEQMVPVLFKKWIKKFNNEIPFSEFKTNNQLIIDSIITTQTFCIAENISPKLIEDIIEIKS